jgi:hypothetical protein
VNYVETAILIIGFNRPRLLKKLLSTVPLSNTRKIYISIDGPRTPIEAIKVNQVRAVVEVFVRKNPRMQIKYRFSEQNLGCKLGVRSAIDWAFDNEDSLIILEDDVVVSSEFFTYMDYFLYHFESDLQIWHINGFSPLLPPYKHQISYLTKFAHVWGWATWKNRWLHYDRDLLAYQPGKLFLAESLTINPLSEEALSFFEKNLIACKNGFDTWDFQWQFSMWIKGGFAISPGERLSGNSGFGPTASHTKFAGFQGLNLPPAKKISGQYRNVDVSKQSDLLEHLHEAIIFGVESSIGRIEFNLETKGQILLRSLPKWVQLKIVGALKKVKPTL